MRGAKGFQNSLLKRERPAQLRLSYAQQRLWFLDRLAGTSVEYNLPQAARLTGELHRDALEKAVNAIVERHESLRTHFAEVEGEPMQVVEPELRIVVPMEDLSAASEEAQQRRIKEELERERTRRLRSEQGTAAPDEVAEIGTGMSTVSVAGRCITLLGMRGRRACSAANSDSCTKHSEKDG